MGKYRVSVYRFENYDGSRVLECYAFSVNPLDSLDECVEWVKSLHPKPDHIRINYQIGDSLFDNEDTRILNNVFYCNKL